jgi:hypothetical protein
MSVAPARGQNSNESAGQSVSILESEAASMVMPAGTVGTKEEMGASQIDVKVVLQILRDNIIYPRITNMSSET